MKEVVGYPLFFIKKELFVTHPLEPIIALQKDLRLIRVLREVQDIPKRKDDIEQQVNGFKRKLDEASEKKEKN